MTKIKRRSVRKSVRKSMRKIRIKGGGCGCNKSASLFSGGNAIPLNSFKTDPSRPSIVGGKKRNKTNRRSRKMRGGYSPYTTNELSVPTLFGLGSLNPAVYSQPVTNIYGAHNRPMV